MNYLPSNDRLQEQLTTAYQRQTQRYDTAHRIATELARAMLSGDAATELQTELAVMMESISKEDAEVAPLRRRWDQSGQRAGDRLRSTVEQLRESIEKAIAAVSNAESQAVEAKHRLCPQLSGVQNARGMVSAYESAKADS